jgi:CMP-N-acetylneuraminic acid synthetase/SAM-dependent methyltransferase
MRNLAVIPARSGSTRLKHKNIKLVAGHPLIYYQIECAKQVVEIDKIFVATDDDYYAQIARDLGAEVIMRPAEISGPDSKTEETLLYVINELEKQGEIFDNVILLQATNPLNRPEYIREAIKAIEEDKKYRSVLTYSESKRFFLDDSDLINRPMTQVKEPKKMETGCFWITNIEALKKEKNRICYPFTQVKVSKEASLDIDDATDLKIVEYLLEREVRLKENKYFKKREYGGDFEDYYGLKPDPDGQLRDITKEKDKKINFCRKEIDFVNNLYRDNVKRNFLDLGCGCGFVSSAIDDSRWNKYGLEVSKRAGAIAKQYIPNVHLGVLTSSTYPEEFFDLVFCSHVIEHVKDPVDFVQNIHKILKTHGNLVISTPNFDSGAARRFGENFRLLHDKSHISLFSDFSLKQLLEDYGFIVDEIDYPFFDTEYFTKENFLRLFDISRVSPPFYGSIMTIYARKK